MRTINIVGALKGLWLVARDILPISIFLVAVQIFVLKAPIDNPKGVALGISLSTLGLYLFSVGLKLGLVPLGNSVGRNLPLLDNILLIAVFAFILGYTATMAEPALSALAMQVEELSAGVMHNRVLVHSVAAGVGLGMVMGVLKILYKVPSTTVIIPMILLTAVLGYFAPESITGIAFDSAGVTTGPVTVPLNMALGIGLSTMIGGSDPLIDGFGVIALASLGPIVTVLLTGIVIKF